MKQTYDILDKHALADNILPFSSDRELLATIDFAVCSAAHFFVGNSVSTFSAHILIERILKRQAVSTHKWLKLRRMTESESFHYNGGRIPLADVLFPDIVWRSPIAIEPSPGDLCYKYSCYVHRYPDLLHNMCTGDVLSCDWRRIANHWRSSGKQGGRKLSCDDVSIAGMAKNAPVLRTVVFTLSLDADKSYHDMLMVAVLSAKKHTAMELVCVFPGSPRKTRLIKWLKHQGVHIIFHVPVWEPHMTSASAEAIKRGLHLHASPLYSDPQQMIATFLRLDVPTLGFIDDYILYADVDVLFTGNVRLQDFGPTLPRYFTIGVELEGGDLSPHSGNMGIMLINTREMQRTHAALVDWIFSPENLAQGLHFGSYGPGDQGALKSFYAGRYLLRAWPRFNWKPYWRVTSDAVIVHFHGPKPMDYVHYWTNEAQELEHHPVYSRLYGQCSHPQQGSSETDGCKHVVDQWLGIFNQSWNGMEDKQVTFMHTESYDLLDTNLHRALFLASFVVVCLVCTRLGRFHLPCARSLPAR